MTSNSETAGTIYRWIERKPLTEAVSWTSREKFWLITAACHFGTHDWKSVAQVVKNAGEQYRPKDWYTSKSCERQFKILVSSLSKEVKSLPLADMLQHIAEGLKNDYLRDANKSKDSLKIKYCNLFSVLNRVKQGNLSRNEVVSLYSQARRNEIEGKQYMEQLMTRQNATLASENSSSGLSEETIKWNTPSAPLLTSLLRSRNTIPANRTVTTITSLLQSPGGTSRTRSGKLLPLSSSVRTASVQGTPTLSKLLEAPANPYLSSPPQSTQKNKPSEVIGPDKLVGNTSIKENSLSTSLNKVRVDNVNTSGSFNQLNKSDLSASKKQTPKSPVSAVKSGSKTNSNIVNLLSDSDNDEEDCKSPVQSTHLKEKKDTNIISRIEPRATRSQTRAEGSFKQQIDCKISDGKKERDTLRQENGESQLTETHHSIEDDLIDIDQIEVEPLTSVQDEINTQTPLKMTRSSVQRSLVNTSAENLLSNKTKSKEINNQMLEEISANFVSSMKNVATEYKNVMVGRSRIDNANISGCIVPIGASVSKEAIIVRKDGQSFPTPVNMLTTFDGKILKQKRIIDLKGTNIKCIDGKISFTNPVVLLKKPFNIKLASEFKNKTDDILMTNNDPKKTIRINNSSQNIVQLLDSHQSFSSKDVTIEDKESINIDDKTTMKTNNSSTKESQNLPLTTISSNDLSNVVSVSKSTSHQSNENKPNNDPKVINLFENSESPFIIPKTNIKVEIDTDMNYSNNQYLKELDFDFGPSISQNAESEFYNGVEEIVEMHSFDNDELNSLIESRSLDNSTIEESHNTINPNHGDSSVSESGSTIGAFDTFAQITRVSPKSSSSKDIKSVNKEPKILKHGGKVLVGDEKFVQSNEVDDQSSSAVSVTGIPVLQNVISDVMSKIDSDRNAALIKATVNKQLNDESSEIIELLSSDEEENDDNEQMSNKLSSNVNDEQTIVDPEIARKTEMLSNDVFSVHQREAFQKNKSNLSSEIQIVKPGVTSNNLEIKSRVSKVIKTLVEKKLYDVQNIHCTIGKKLIETNNKNLELGSVKSALLFSKVNQDNDKTEMKSNEKETKVLLVNEMIKKSKEIALRTSSDKLQETLKNVKDTEEKILNEAVEKDKKVKNDQLLEFEAEKIKRAKEVQKEQFEAEFMQRNKRTLAKKQKIPEITKMKEAEMNKSIETEMEKIKDIEMKKEIEIMKAKEIEMKKTKDIEMQKAKEIEVRDITAQKAQEISLQKVKEAQIQCIKDDELKQAKEAEVLKKFKEAKLKKDTEMTKCLETEVLLKGQEKNVFKSAEVNEVQRNKQSTLLKCKESQFKKLSQQDLEIQNLRENQKRFTIKENDLNCTKNTELNNCIENEINHMNITEVQKTSNEVEVQKVKEVESKEKDKNVILKRIDFKKTKEMEVKETQLKKSKEADIKIRMVEVKVQLQRENLNDQSKKTNKSEQSNHEAKKVNTVETGMKESDTETIKSKEQSLKSNKSNEIEVKKVKETKEVENKINTRTRGSKTEEKLKDSNIATKNIMKSTSVGKSVGSSSSMSSTSQQIKNVCDENKLNDGINNCDKDLSSSECSKKEISGKSRTRSSSSFKKNTSVNVISSVLHKSNEKNENVVVSKANIGVKTRILTTSSLCEIPSSTINPQHNANMSRRELITRAFTENNLGKQLTVPLVKITTNQKPYHVDNSNPRPTNSSSMKPSMSNTGSIPENTVSANEIIEKPAPKKRGRKRRIDVQMVNSSSQQNLQNGATFNTSTKDVEPLAKRTRRSIETRESRKETVVKYPDNLNTKENRLKHLLKAICERNKSHITLIETEIVRDLPPETEIIVKLPIFLQDITKKINSGEISKKTDLYNCLLMLSYNAIMINRSLNKVFDDISNFQDNILNDYLANLKHKIKKKKLKNVADNINNDVAGGFTGFNPKDCISIGNVDSSNNAGCVQNDNKTKSHNRLTRSNKESSSDSESDRALPPKKRRRTFFFRSSIKVIDSDSYDADI